MLWFHRIAAFIRRSEAFNVCMVLDTRELDPYQGHGYHLPLDIKETPSGVGAFPAIFSFPGVCILVVLGRLLKFPGEFSTTPGWSDKPISVRKSRKPMETKASHFERLCHSSIRTNLDFILLFCKIGRRVIAYLKIA